MSYTTISSLQLQGDWPSNYGASGTLGIFCTSDFVADDGKAFQGGDGSSLTSQFVTKAAITVSANVATVASFSLPKTDQASPNTIRYFGVIFKATGSPTDDYIFTNFHLRASLGNSINYLAWWNDNQQITRPQDDSRPTTSQMNTAILAAINNPASTTQLGLVEVDTTPTDTAHPVVVGSNSYRLTTQGKDIRDFGVVGDFSTDDTAKFQDAINNSLGRRIFIPRQLVIKVTGLRNYGKIGVIIEGEKGGSYQDTGSKIVYAGANHGTLYDLVNSGSITLKDLTLSSGGFTEGLSTYADRCLNIDKSTDTGTYGSGSTSDITVENVTLLGGTTNTNTPNASFVGILVNKTGTSNCELMKFRRVFGFFGGVNYNDPTNVNRGRFIQFYNNGNNSLNNVVEDCYGLGAYILYEARNGAQVRFENNEGNFPSIAYKIAGAGNCQVIGDRTETCRQFLVATGAGVTLLNNIIPYGGWDATGTYPVISVASSSTLEMLRNEFQGVHTPGVKYLAGDATSRLRSICNSYLDNAQALADFLTFGQGAQSASDGVSDGSGVTFNNGYPIIYPGVSGGQAKQGILSSYDYVSQAFYPAFMQHTDSGLGKAIECGADRLIMAKGQITSDLEHKGTKAGFFNTAAIVKPTVTGSRGANAALASLLVQLAALGLVIDSSS